MTRGHLKAVGEQPPDPWDDTMRAGAESALQQVLAKRPRAIAILYETDGDFNFLAFPPGEAASRWMIKTLAEGAVDSGIGPEGD